MTTDIGTSEKRYFDACKRLEFPRISQSWQRCSRSYTTAAKIKKARHEVSSFMVSIDDLKDVDFYPLLDLLTEIDSSEIDVVNFVNGPSCVLNGEYVYPLLHAVNKKLRVGDIHDTSFGKDFLLDRLMAVLKAIQQQLEAFNKMYKEDKENSDRRLQDLTICFDEFFSTRSNVRLDAGSNDSHTHHRSDPKKRWGTPTRGKGAGTSMFVQSLRGDPFRDFNMNILAAYIRPSSNSEIFKVNLLAHSDHDKTHSYAQ